MAGEVGLALLGAAGAAAGFANAVAGGGALIVFPAMLLAGLPPTVANASTALAVWPGHAAAVPPAAGLLRGLGPRLAAHCALGAAGGAAGALLLLSTGDRLLRDLVPWLLLAATLLFAAAPRIRRRAATRAGRGGAPSGFLERAAETGCAVYGGYFGAGLGVLLMALYEATGASGGDPRAANALKNAVASVVTGVAVLGFAASGVVAWAPTLAAMAGAVFGGWLGGRALGRADPSVVRRVVLAAATLLTAREFWAAWTGGG